jgi:hypothetical protein
LIVAVCERTHPCALTTHSPPNPHCYSFPPCPQKNKPNQVLRTIESLRLRGVKGDEFRMKLEEVLQKCLPMTTGSEAEVKKDQISHFILRIAYCKTCVPCRAVPHRAVLRCLLSMCMRGW